MASKEILEKIREQLTGDTDKDMKYLTSEAEKYMEDKTGDSEDIVAGISDMMFEITPDSKKNVIREKMFIGNRRMDRIYQEAEKLTSDRKTEEALKLTTQLYDKIKAVYRETEEAKYMSFRNPLEHQLYLFIYAASKRLDRPPFDLSKYILLHAYNLVEAHKPAEAVKALNDAIRYNPVNPEPYFELAECYKLLMEPSKLLQVTKETLMISTTPYALSRCYTNLGYYCVEKHDYDSAVCFYYESLIFANNPAVQGELQNISSITGKKIVPPIRKEVEAAFKKYDLTIGADKDVLNVVAALAQEAIKGSDKELARFYLITLYGLTRDPEVGDMLDKKYGGIPESLKK